MKNIFITLTLFFVLSASGVQYISALEDAAVAETEGTESEKKENGFTRALNATGNAFKTAGFAVAGYFNNTDGDTRHLEAYNSFSLSLFPSRYKIGLATDFPIGITEILGANSKWKKNGYLVIDLDKVYDTHAIKTNGLDFNMEFFFKNVLGFTFAFKDGNSAAGLSIGNVDARFDFNISEDLFKTLADGIKKDTYSYGMAFSGAVFAEMLSLNYNHKGFYGKVPKLFFSATASLYTPLIYIPKSEININIDNSTDEKIDMYLKGTAEMYSFINPSNGGMTPIGGFDLSLQAEYAIFAIMDVGVTAMHIPVVPATMRYGKTLEWTGETKLLEIDNLMNMKNGMPEPDMDAITKPLDNIEFDSVDPYTVVRPMRWDFYALYRPLRRDILTLRPNIGFTVLTPSKDPYFNLGLEVQFNAGRLFTASFFTGGFDGLCRNKLMFDLHVWKISRFVMGLEMRSQDYGGAWSLKGAAVEIGWNWGGGYRGVTNF